MLSTANLHLYNAAAAIMADLKPEEVAKILTAGANKLEVGSTRIFPFLVMGCVLNSKKQMV